MNPVLSSTDETVGAWQTYTQNNYYLKTTLLEIGNICLMQGGELAEWLTPQAKCLALISQSNRLDRPNCLSLFVNYMLAPTPLIRSPDDTF